MAALVVVNSDCSKLSKAAIKKSNPRKLTTIKIYIFFEINTIVFLLVYDTEKIAIINAQDNKLKVILCFKISLKFGIKIKETHMQENLQNQNVSPIQTPLQEQPLKKFTSNPRGFVLVIIGVIIMLLVVAGGAYYLGTRQGKPASLTTQTPQKSPNSPTTTITESDAAKQKISFVSSEVLTVSDPDGSNREVIYKPTREADSYLTWEWSPDGKKIVTSGKGGLVIDISTKVQSNLPSGRCHNWSPDGKKIIYEYNGIFSIDPDGSNNKKLTDSGSLCRGSNDTTHWMADSQSFIYTNKNGLNVFDIRTNTNKVIHDSNIKGVDLLSASVPKSGNAVAFVGRTKYDMVTRSSTIANIYLVNPDGSNLVQLTNFKSVDEPGDATFTTDGKSIIFSVNNSNSQYNGISIIDIQTKTIRVLSNHQVDSYYPPSLSKDGKFVAYDGGDGSYIVNIQTNDVSKFTNGQHILWSK